MIPAATSPLRSRTHLTLTWSLRMAVLLMACVVIGQLIWLLTPTPRRMPLPRWETLPAMPGPPSTAALPLPPLPPTRPQGPTVDLVVRPQIRENASGSSALQYLVLADLQHTYSVPWGFAAGRTFFPFTLDTNQVYRFTVREETISSGSLQFTNAVLCVVSQNGRRIYDAEICHVHQTVMEWKYARIHYGLQVGLPGEPSFETEQKQFPNWRDWTSGGCVVTPDSPISTMMFVCPQCQTAYTRWKAEHPAPPPANPAPTKSLSTF